MLQHPTDAPAIHRITRQAIYLPAHNAVCFVALDAAHHFLKHRTTRCFRASFFYKLFGDIKSVASRERTQLGELRFNTQHLFILAIG
ncbi:MAG: hypothetical protein A2854_04250 [Parcubacteria group bacterium RIFCSPHIGHO2_01_FULL_56_18]|nr:MAG: hypothetical protein A2854_04250 [Parcubacteria group bacterium RIFCSPHIGHO2_01_FULL_56_18]